MDGSLPWHFTLAPATDHLWVIYMCMIYCQCSFDCQSKVVNSPLSLPSFPGQGLSEQTSRKDWPISIMRGVMQDLIKDTPSDLLAK